MPHDRDACVSILDSRIADPIEDEAILYSLFRDARAAEFCLLNWDATRLDALLRSQFEAQRSDYNLRFPSAQQRIFYIQGDAVALTWVWRPTDQIRLLDIVVATGHRNRGIGTTLLRELQAEASSRSLPLRHMVAVTNEGALRFYSRLGFAVVADARTHLLMEYLPEPGNAKKPRPPAGD